MNNLHEMTWQDIVSENCCYSYSAYSKLYIILCSVRLRKLVPRTFGANGVLVQEIARVVEGSVKQIMLSSA